MTSLRKLEILYTTTLSEELFLKQLQPDKCLSCGRTDKKSVLLEAGRTHKACLTDIQLLTINIFHINIGLQMSPPRM